LFGFGVIIGKYTGKLLYTGVRNKYCAACVNNSKTQKKINHVYFKNSEEALESDIIVEGFNLAEEESGTLNSLGMEIALFLLACSKMLA